MSSLNRDERYHTASTYPPLPPYPPTLDIATFIFNTHSPYTRDIILESRHPVLTDPIFDDNDVYIGERSWTFPQWKDRVERFGRMLVNPHWGLSLGNGEVVGLMGKNSAGFATVEYGTFWAYGTVSMIVTTWELRQVIHQMKEANTKILALDSSCLISLGIPACNALNIPLNRILLLDAYLPTGANSIYSQLRAHPELHVPPGYHFRTVEGMIELQREWEEDFGHAERLAELEIIYGSEGGNWIVDRGDFGRKIRRKSPEEVGFDARRDVALLCCTSGTTGLPKAVMLSHENMVNSVLQAAGRPYDDEENGKAGGGGTDGARLIGLPPWCYQGGQACGVMQPLYKRWNNVVIDSLDLKRLLELMEIYKPREIDLYPYFIHLFSTSPLTSQHLTQPSLHTLHDVISIGAPLSSSTIRSFTSRFPLIQLRQSMGATETTAFCTMQSSESWLATPGSCGQLPRSIKALIVPIVPEPPTQIPQYPSEEALKTLTGKAAGTSGGIGVVTNAAVEGVPERLKIPEQIKRDDAPGEVFFSGPNIMLGYLNDPIATARALYYYPTGPNGEVEKWYRTGDVMATKNNGRDFYHMGRLKDMIWYRDKHLEVRLLEGGILGVQEVEEMKVTIPVDVERILELHGSVREVAVVGVAEPEDNKPGMRMEDPLDSESSARTGWDRRESNVPRAYVVLKEEIVDGEVIDDPEKLQRRESLRVELTEFVDQRVSDHSRLRGGMQFVRELPKNIAGKVIRTKLQKHHDH